MATWLTGLTWLILGEVLGPAPGHAPWLRTSDPQVQEAVDDGLRHSRTFRALALRVLQAGGVVYVVVNPALPKHVTAALEPQVHGEASAKYLRVFARAGRRGAVLTVSVAHELQHVVELLGARDARSPTECERVFARIGFRSGPRSYETTAALTVGQAVSEEMKASYLSVGSR